MAITKRTPKEIEEDCKRIREAAKTATCIRDLERATHLSNAKIKTTLSKNPIIFKRIKEQLSVNKEQAQIEKKKRKEQETLAKKEEKARLKAEKKAKSDVTVNRTEVVKSKDIVSKKVTTHFVIDASITGVKTLREDLSKICATKSKIILTSITIKELERMQKFGDIDGLDARYILAIAAENMNSFETVLIDETFDTPDDCIIHYCAENKENVTLLTSDKTMALKARMYNVQVNYLKQNNSSNNNVKNQSKSKVITLVSAQRIANKLFISEFNTSTRSICVCSNGLEYIEGIRELKIGDDVFVSTKKPDYITFAHYKIISLFAENNCKLIYSKRIYDYNDIDVPKAAYKSFIKDFKHRLDL